MAYTKIQKIEMIADDMARSSKDALAKFAEGFAKDPHYAFSWGQQAVEASAKHHVSAMLTDYVTKVRANQPEWKDDAVADCVVNELEKELIRRARWPEHSSSEISNMTAIARTAAIGEFVARMRGE